jgi:hypothetical protein
MAAGVLITVTTRTLWWELTRMMTTVTFASLKDIKAGRHEVLPALRMTTGKPVPAPPTTMSILALLETKMPPPG